MNSKYFIRAAFWGILTLLSIIMLVITNSKDTDKKESTLPRYKVYYEYNIINNDTIPVDTIFVMIPDTICNCILDEDE